MIVVVLLAMFLAPGRARAWTEARASGLVTELTVDRDGGATVALRIRWTVLGGRMHQFDLVDLPTDLSLLEATAVAGNGTPVPVSAHSPSPGRLEVDLGDESRGVRRGTVDVVVRYTTSLRAQGAIQRAGADAVLEVVTVPWARGVEAVEMRVALPATARRAQWIADDTPGVEAATSTELSRDVVHALRRHLPSNERWRARIAIDPAVFPWLSAGPSRRPAALRRAPPPYGTAALLALGLTLALALASRALSRVAPPSDPSRARLSAALGVAGVLAQSLMPLHVPAALTLGTLLVLAAAWMRAPSPAPRRTALAGAPRTLSDDQVRARARVRFGLLRPVAAALAVGFVALSFVASAWQRAPLAVAAVDAAVALAAWIAWVSRAETAGDASVLVAVAPRVRSLLRGDARARVGWRVRGDLRERGSLRMRLVPRPGWRQARGLLSVECAVVETASAFGAACAPELLVRVEPGSALERDVRLLATRAGTLASSPDGDALILRMLLAGAEADVALAGLASLLPDLFVKVPDAASRSRDLGELLGAGAGA